MQLNFCSVNIQRLLTRGSNVSISIAFCIEKIYNSEGAFDGDRSRVDASARQVESAEDHARGIIVDWQQQWSDFAPPKFADLIIYETHVWSFAGLNDHLNISTYATFADFETKLGYIR